MFFVAPRTGGLQGAVAQLGELLPALLIHVLGVGQPSVAAAFQPLIVLAGQPAVLSAPHPVNGVPKVSGNVKLVERDLLLRVRHVLGAHADVWFPHVHGDRLDTC